MTEAGKDQVMTGHTEIAKSTLVLRRNDMSIGQICLKNKAGIKLPVCEKERS